jgi:hypothetical protein
VFGLAGNALRVVLCACVTGPARSSLLLPLLCPSSPSLSVILISAHLCSSRLGLGSVGRLDIPLYRSKSELKRQLNLVLSMEVSGFGIE